MDPIEIFELTGYVVQAPANDADLAVFATEIRPYMVQRARSANTVFASEIRAYMIGKGGPKTGVAANTTAAYVIVTDPRAQAMTHLGTHAIIQRQPGVSIRQSTMYHVNGATGSEGIHNRTPGGRPSLFGGPGVAVVNSAMYTIEVP